jgi:hypothetical protein
MENGNLVDGVNTITEKIVVDNYGEIIEAAEVVESSLDTDGEIIEVEEKEISYPIVIQDIGNIEPKKIETLELSELIALKVKSEKKETEEKIKKVKTIKEEEKVVIDATITEIEVDKIYLCDTYPDEFTKFNIKDWLQYMDFKIRYLHKVLIVKYLPDELEDGTVDLLIKRISEPKAPGMPGVSITIDLEQNVVYFRKAGIKPSEHEKHLIEDYFELKKDDLVPRKLVYSVNKKKDKDLEDGIATGEETIDGGKND